MIFDFFKNNNNNIEYNNNIKILDNYINFIKTPENFSGEIAIYAMSKLLNISIYVFHYENNLKKYRFLYKYENEKDFINYCMILKHEYFISII